MLPMKLFGSWCAEEASKNISDLGPLASDGFTVIVLRQFTEPFLTLHFPDGNFKILGSVVSDKDTFPTPFCG
jgi:hypothetical protein